MKAPLLFCTLLFTQSAYAAAASHDCTFDGAVVTTDPVYPSGAKYCQSKRSSPGVYEVTANVADGQPKPIAHFLATCWFASKDGQPPPPAEQWHGCVVSVARKDKNIFYVYTNAQNPNGQGPREDAWFSIRYVTP